MIAAASMEKNPFTFVMAIYTIRLNKYFLDTFIEVVDDLTNWNDDKIKNIDKIDNNLPESRRYEAN